MPNEQEKSFYDLYCYNCKIKKEYAKLDLHCFDKDDCPFKAKENDNAE